jgi:hypothetical protein
MNPTPEAVRVAIEAALGSDEHVDLIAPAVGCSLVLTDRHLAVVRDGAAYRPKTGVRSFVLARGLEVRIGPARRRVIIELGGRTINLFVRSEQLHQAEVLLAEARRRIQQAGPTPHLQP